MNIQTDTYHQIVNSMTFPLVIINLQKKITIINISEFAKNHDINYKLLKLHNPWLIQNHLNNNSRKYYEIAIPE